MSMVIGASATGARAYTATASQGLLYMTEAVFNASGMELPIVMTVANRAIGAPINIWNDHSDAMALRDCGWLQLYAADNQEAADLHVQAFRLAEALSLPVMVCMDGFVLTHAFEEVDVPEQDQVDLFLPPLRPQQRLDPDAPGHHRHHGGPGGLHRGALPGAPAAPPGADPHPIRSPRSSRRSSAGPPLDSSGLTAARTPVPSSSRSAPFSGPSRTSSTSGGTAGRTNGVLGVTSFRPFPDEELRDALSGARRVVVLERAFAVGNGGVVTADVRRALAGRAVEIVHRRRGARRPAHHQGGPARHAGRRRPGRARPADLPGPRPRRRRPRAGPARRRPCRTCRSRGHDTRAPVKFYQVGSFAVGNRLLR